MFDVQPRLYFDFVDPGSLLLWRRMRALDAACGLVGFEMRPPPAPPVDASDPAWTAYWDEVAADLAAIGLEPSRPIRVPWTRKAHELVEHARQSGAPERALEMCDRLFRAYVEEGVDLGRIDVLVGLAVDEGFDRTEVRAVLDVDRYRSDVEDGRRRAVDLGVRGVPTLLVGDRRLEGIHDVRTLRAFLEDG